MGSGPIGEVVTSGGAESRTEFPATPKAASAPRPHSSDPKINQVFGERVAGQRGTQTVFDQGGAGYLSIGMPKPSFVDNSAFSIAMKGEDESELRDLMSNLTRDIANDVKLLDNDILSVVRSMAGDLGKYRRERKQALKAIVSEVYPAPRTTAAVKLLPELRLIPGFALDLTTVDPDDNSPWDFDNPRKRAKAMQMVRDQSPMLFVGSPMCTAFSTWQRINDKIQDPEICANEKKRAIMHLSFCVILC